MILDREDGGRFNQVFESVRREASETRSEKLAQAHDMEERARILLEGAKNLRREADRAEGVISNLDAIKTHVLNFLNFLDYERRDSDTEAGVDAIGPSRPPGVIP